MRFDPPRMVKLDGTSIWSNTSGKMSVVSEIRVRYTAVADGLEDGVDGVVGGWVLVDVQHTLHWPIYTDEGFEREISALMSEVIGQPVIIGFTEQGMQDDYIASMESADLYENGSVVTPHTATTNVLKSWVLADPE